MNRDCGWFLHLLVACSIGTGCAERPPTPTPSASTTAAQASQLMSPVEHYALERAMATHDFEGANAMLEALESKGVNVEQKRARLAFNLGDCAAALDHLGSVEGKDPESVGLRTLVQSCLGVTAHAPLDHHPGARLSVRWQNPQDRVMTPGLVTTVTEARQMLRRVLGIELEGTVRVEVVTDTFSLAHLAGLSIVSAEKTGTVAVARFGRVMMLSPRSTRDGYPWQDTLCHELVHLAVSQASADQAPIWLQEGLAKQLETGWRNGPRDREREVSHALAIEALRTGELLPIEDFPESLTLLPNPKSARYAYAVAHDFVEYLAERHTMAAIRLLLHEFGQLGLANASKALHGATSEPLAEHTVRWLSRLRQESTTRSAPLAEADLENRLEARQALRLGELLTEVGAHGAAKKLLYPILAVQPTSASVRTWLARALLENGEPSAALQAIGTPEQVQAPSGPWFALRGRILLENGLPNEASAANSAGFALRPQLGEADHSALAPRKATKQRD